MLFPVRVRQLGRFSDHAPVEAGSVAEVLAAVGGRYMSTEMSPVPYRVWIDRDREPLDFDHNSQALDAPVVETAEQRQQRLEWLARRDWEQT